jgi:hypothetical protein
MQARAVNRSERNTQIPESKGISPAEKHATGQTSAGTSVCAMFIDRQERHRGKAAPAALSLGAIVALALCLALSACGSSKTKGDTGATAATASRAQSPQAEKAAAEREALSGLAPPRALSPDTVLARVGSAPITYATVRHQMQLKSVGSPLPEPPAYSACIAHQKAAAGTGSPAALKQACETFYQQLLAAALTLSIHARWLLGEAAEEGLRVTPRELEREFQASKQQFRTEAEFSAYRKSTGQSVSDMFAELKLGKLTDGIFKNIKRRERAVTAADVSAYYNAHSAKFAIPEGRDVRILRTTTEASALRALKQLRQGASFQSIVAGLSHIGQPIGAEHGEVKNLLPGVFEEKKLNDAIFSAQLHRLYGPLRLNTLRRTIAPETNSGFFIFEVLGKVPGRQLPLAEVKAKIAEELAKERKASNLASSVAAIKAKWRARSVCEPGFVVKNCRQYKGPEATSSTDPYTL